MLTALCIHHAIIWLQSFCTGICGRKPSCVVTLAHHRLHAWTWRTLLQICQTRLQELLRVPLVQQVKTQGFRLDTRKGLTVRRGRLLIPNRLAWLQENLVPLQTELTTLSCDGRLFASLRLAAWESSDFHEVCEGITEIFGLI